MNKKYILEFSRFAIVGLIATLIHYLVYIFLLSRISANIAFTVAYLISLLVNYCFTVKFTFKSKSNVKKGFGFIGSHLINYLAQIILLNLFVHLGVNESIAPVPVYMVVVPMNFLLLRFVFNNNKFN